MLVLTHQKLMLLLPSSAAQQPQLSSKLRFLLTVHSSQSHTRTQQFTVFTVQFASCQEASYHSANRWQYQIVQCYIVACS